MTASYPFTAGHRPAVALRAGLAAALGALLLTTAGPALAESCYVADQDSGELGFTGVQEGLPFDGRFGQFSVRYCMDPDAPENGRIEVSVETSTARTGEAMRDDVLQGAEFFFTGRFPHASWQSDSIEAVDDGYVAEGDLTIRDITRATPVEFTLEREDGEFRMIGSAQLLRLDFDVGTGENANPNFIGHDVGVSFDLALSPEAS